MGKKCREDIINKTTEVYNALDILKDIFNNTNAWLNFAEVKNGALLGVNGLFLFESVNYLFDILNGNIDSNLIVIVGLITFIFLITMLIVLKSFFPNTSKEGTTSIIKEGKSRPDSILIFYEDISKYKSAEVYLKDIYKYYMKIEIKTEDIRKIELDYAKEILINSRITSVKYRHFKLALKMYFFAVFIFAIFILLA